MHASRDLEGEGIGVRMLNMHTIKPLDRDAILKAAAETRGIVTTEEHHLTGGLGGAVAELLAVEHPTRMRLGLHARRLRRGWPHRAVTGQVWHEHRSDYRGLPQPSEQSIGRQQRPSRLLATTAEFWVPDIAQRIPKEIETQDGQTDGQTGEDGEPRGLFHKGTSGTTKHQTPGWRWGLSAQA
jgi:hypothetical protein